MSPQALIDDVARRHGFSSAAVQEAVAALQRSGGGQAQFGHPDLGGMGQWMPGMLMIGDMFNSGLKSRVDALFQELSRRLNEFSLPAVPGTPAGDGYRSAGLAAPPPQTFSPPSQAFGGQSQSQGFGGQPQNYQPGYGSQPQTSFSYGYNSAPQQNWYPAELGVPASSGSQNNFRYAFFPSTRRLAIELDGHLSVFDTDDHTIGGVSQQQETGGGRVTFTSQYGVVDLARLRRVS